MSEVTLYNLTPAVPLYNLTPVLGERTALEKGVDGPLDVPLRTVQEELCLLRRRTWIFHVKRELN